MNSTMQQRPLSLNDFVERAGTLFPDRPLISRLPDKSLVRHDYREFRLRVRGLAAGLLAAGLRKGERVATLCWNHHVHLEAYFGIPAAGGVMHTLNLRLAPEDIGWIAGHADDRFIIVDDILLPLLAKVAPLHRFERIFVYRFSGAPLASHGAIPDAPPLEDYEDLLADAATAEAFEYPEHDENDPTSMCYTSGTTGRPKGVVYSHRSTVLHSLVGALPDCVNICARDVIMPVTPMFHANSWGVPYTAVMTGASLVFPGPHLHAEDLLDLMQLAPPTMALGVPTIWLSLIQAYEAHPGRWQLPKGLRSLIGGSAAPESLIRDFARNGVELGQGWGMTETSPLGTVFSRKPELADLSEDEWLHLRSFAGIPVPLVDVRIVDDEGQACPWDGTSVGELQVRGPYITGSYHGDGNDPSKFTADGFLRTGDVAAINEHGFMRIADRTKDLIKSGGEWISSVDLENAIMAHPAVAEAAVIAIPHPKWDERPLACVVVKPGQRITAEELRAHLAPQFASWQLPDAVEFIDEIPRTSTGKFWKAKLRERFPGTHAQKA